MQAEITSFEDLKTYQAGRELRIFVSKQIIPLLLTAKEFDLLNQIKRCSRSVTANLAEGYGRFHYLDNAKFCSNARGSLCETLEHLITANDESLISDDLLLQCRDIYNNALKLLNGYINYRMRKARY